MQRAIIGLGSILVVSVPYNCFIDAIFTFLFCVAICKHIIIFLYTEKLCLKICRIEFVSEVNNNDSAITIKTAKGIETLQNYRELRGNFELRDYLLDI